MTYAFTYEVPITAEIYARIKDGIGPQRPAGLIAHLAYRTQTGLRYVEVWQAKDDWLPGVPLRAATRILPLRRPSLKNRTSRSPPYRQSIWPACISRRTKGCSPGKGCT